MEEQDVGARGLVLVHSVFFIYTGTVVPLLS